MAKWFTPGTVKSPPLLHAQAIDLDLDGLADVVGLSKDRRAVLLHNDAVVQGLSEVPFMQDVERWGVLTIGTGLGNAHFTNR